MKMTTAEYEEHQDDNAGFCSQCDSVTTSDVEPDAEGYECPECGGKTVKGIENALIYGDVEITDDEKGDGEEEPDNVISFSDDEDDDGLF